MASQSCLLYFWPLSREWECQLSTLQPLLLSSLDWWSWHPQGGLRMLRDALYSSFQLFLSQKSPPTSSRELPSFVSTGSGDPNLAIKSRPSRTFLAAEWETALMSSRLNLLGIHFGIAHLSQMAFSHLVHVHLQAPKGMKACEDIRPDSC